MPKTKNQKKKSNVPAKTDQPANYEEIANKSLVAANAAHFKIICQKAAKLFALSEKVKSGMIDSANLTREIGLELQMVLNKRQMRTEDLSYFLRQHATDLPEWLTPDAARRFLSAADQFPEPVTELAQARNVMEQMTFQAVGMLEEPHRETVQTAVRQAPLERVINVWQKYDETLGKFCEQYPEKEWDLNTVTTMADATRGPAELHERLVKRREELKSEAA